jgi:hypothetical protein
VKSPNFDASSNSYESFIAINAKICQARSAEDQPVSQKKNDGGGLRESCHPARATVSADLPRPPPERPTGSGSRGDGDTLHRSAKWSGRGHRTVTLAGAGRGASNDSVCLRAGGQIRRDSFPPDTHRGRLGTDRGAVLSMPLSCNTGQLSADVQLDIEKTDFSPGVRRMLAAVGNEASFAQGRDQIKLLAGLEVTAKAGRTLKLGNKPTSGAPNNCICRSLLAHRFLIYTCRWTALKSTS